MRTEIRRTHILCVAVALATLSLAACKQHDNTQSPRTSTTPSTPQSQTTPPSTEKQSQAPGTQPGQPQSTENTQAKRNDGTTQNK
jgi:hypothetical protein